MNPNSTLMSTVTGRLTIAHLDYDEENHDVSDDRLAAQCQGCHASDGTIENTRRIMVKAPQVALALKQLGGDLYLY